MSMVDNLGGWLGNDGLMKMRLDGYRPAYSDDMPSTVYGDNGILLLAYWAMLNKEKAKTMREQINWTLSLLEEKPGLFNRNPKRQDLRDYKDNTVGILYLSQLLDLRYHVAIWRYGKAHCYNYQNIKPYTPIIQTQYQGSMVALIQIVARQESPSMVNKVWLAGSVALSTDRLQVFLIIKNLDMAGYKDKAYLLARGKFLKGFNLPHEIKTYFREPSHPCRVTLGV